MGRQTCSGQRRSDVSSLHVRQQEVGGYRNQDEGNGREPKNEERKELRGAGNYSGPPGLLPRIERVSTAHADPHGKRVEGYHAHGSDKGLEANGKQSG